MEKDKIKCPRCGSTDIARYMYGLPLFSEELQRKLDEGEVVLGGCVINPVKVNGKTLFADMPTQKCNKCGKDFGAEPLLYGKDKDAPERWIDCIRSVELSVLTQIGSECLDVSVKKTDKGADAVVLSGFDVKKKQISAKKWEDFLGSLLYDFYLPDWKKNYSPKDIIVLDGTSWYLELSLTGGRRRTWKGSNEFPPYWDELLRECRKLVK